MRKSHPIDPRILSFLRKFDERGIRRFEHASSLINLWQECENVLIELKKKNVNKDIYYDNLFALIKTLSDCALKSIKNHFESGYEDVLVETVKTKYGNNLIEEYNYFFNMMLRLEKDKITEEMFVEKYDDFKILFNKAKKSNQSCYIATMAYGDYNHSQVLELRKFRDEFLSKTIIGRNFIKLYYKYSPSLVQRLKNKKGINLIIRKALDQFIKTIKK